MRALTFIVIVSSILFAGTVVAQNCTAPPSAPNGLRSSQADGRLTLEWNAPNGGTPGSYRYEAGSSPGASDLVSISRPGNVTSYNVPIANGQYHVRIFAKNQCGTSPPSNEIRVDVTQGAEPNVPNPRFVLGSRMLRADTFGDAMIAGEVVNGWGAAPAALIEIDARFLGAGAQEVDREIGFVLGRARRLRRSGLPTDTVLPAGVTGCYHLHTGTPMTRVDDVDVRLSHESFPVEGMPGRVEFDGPVRRSADLFGDLELSGRLVNRGERRSVINAAFFAMYNDKLRTLDCTVGIVQGSPVTLNDGTVLTTALRVGESGPFTGITFAPFDQVAFLENWVFWADERGLVALTTQSDPSVRSFVNWRTGVLNDLAVRSSVLTERELAHAWRAIQLETRRLARELEQE